MKFRHLVSWIAVALFLSACIKEKRGFSISVSTEEPGEKIAEALSETLRPIGYELTVTPKTHQADIFAAVSDGSVDFAIVEEPPRMLPGMAVIAPLYPTVLHVLHRNDRKPKDFAEVIRGQKIYTGPEGGAGRRLMNRFATEFGVANTDYELLDNPWTEDPDVWFILGDLLGPESAQNLSGYTLFSFGDAALLGHGTIAESIVLRFPHIHSFILPKRLYGDLNDSAILTLSLRSLLISSPQLDEQYAYEIAARIFEHSQELATVYPLVSRELGNAFEGSDLSIPLHPGVQRYLDKDKPGFLERYVEVIALMLTVMAAAASALLGVYRWRQQTKKDRVDVFYKQVLELRSRIVPNITAEQASALSGDVRRVQEEVFSLLVDERVNADATLTIFLDLSNQVLKELHVASVTSLA